MKDNKKSVKSRNLSPGEYFDVIHREYVIASLRSKIYPSRKDKEYWRKVSQYKKNRIMEMSERNGLKNMFQDNDMREKIQREMFNECNVPNFLSGKDLEYYYSPNNDFQFCGEIWTLVHFDTNTQRLTLRMKNDCGEITVLQGEANRVL